jgi:Lamin Tail Domain
MASAGPDFMINNTQFKPHGYVKIHTGQGANSQADRYWAKSWYVWNNTGDTATLRDAGGHLLDQCTFKGTSRGYVFC